MSADLDTATEAPERAQRFGVADAIVAVILAAWFAANLYGAIGDLLGVPVTLTALGAMTWVVLIPLVGKVVAPVVLFVLAMLLGRGRTTFQRALILVVALAANSAVALSFTAWAYWYFPI